MTTPSLLMFLTLLGVQDGAMRSSGDLLPEEGSFGLFRRRDELALSEMLLPYDRSRRSVLVVQPAFEAEWTVFVADGPKGRQIVLRTLRKPLFAESTDDARSKNGDVQFVPPPGTVDPKAVVLAAEP